jgi:hypothetical protein
MLERVPSAASRAMSTTITIIELGEIALNDVMWTRASVRGGTEKVEEGIAFGGLIIIIMGK